MTAPRPLARVVPKVAGKALGKRGMAFGALMTDWATILGPELGRCTMPQKLAFPPGLQQDAVLHIRVTGAAALEVQHAEPQIVERINAFFGYRAIARLKLVQAPAADPLRRRPKPRALTPEEEAGIVRATEGIEDEALRESLARFGRSMMASRRPVRRDGD
jgi:hypothetical protein